MFDAHSIFLLYTYLFLIFKIPNALELTQRLNQYSKIDPRILTTTIPNSLSLGDFQIVLLIDNLVCNLPQIKCSRCSVYILSLSNGAQVYAREFLIHR